MQGCIKFLILLQVLKRRREYHGCGEEYQVGKRGRGTENLGKKIKI